MATNYNSGNGLKAGTEANYDAVGTWLHTDLVVDQQTRKQDKRCPTLAVAFGVILDRLQILYGPRDEAFTVLGIEFRTGGSRISYTENRRQIVIQLGLECAAYPQLAYFQLARESVYLLSPSGCSATNMLEAGLSTHFAQEYRPRQLQLIRSLPPTRFGKAKDLADQLLAIDESAVRQIRLRQPMLSQVTEEDIHQTCPHVPPELARALSVKFDRLR